VKRPTGFRQAVVTARVEQLEGEGPRLLALAGLLRAIGPLNADELDVVGWVIERLRLGNERYGPLNVGSDTRDLVKERNEEIVDALVYAGVKAVQEARDA